MTIDDNQLARLQELAEGATPGPWRQGSVTGQCHMPEHGSNGHGRGKCKYDYRIVADDEWSRSQVSIEPNVTLIGTDDNGPVLSERNAAFIAAANPTTVLALLDRLRRAEAVVDVMRRADPDDRVSELTIEDADGKGCYLVNYLTDQETRT